MRWHLTKASKNKYSIMSSTTKPNINAQQVDSISTINTITQNIKMHKIYQMQQNHIQTKIIQIKYTNIQRAYPV